MLRRPAYSVYDNGTPSTAALTNASGLALAANPNRKYAIIFNNSAIAVFLAVGTAAVLNAGISVGPNGGWYEITSANLTGGAIYAIAASGTPSLSILEGT